MYGGRAAGAPAALAAREAGILLGVPVFWVRIARITLAPGLPVPARRALGTCVARQAGVLLPARRCGITPANPSQLGRQCQTAMRAGAVRMGSLGDQRDFTYESGNVVLVDVRERCALGMRACACGRLRVVCSAVCPRQGATENAELRPPAWCLQPPEP